MGCIGIASVAAALLVLGIVGCGGGGGSTSTAASAKADFLKKGNEICRKGNQKLAVANKQAFSAYIRSGSKAPPAKVRNYVTTTLIPDVQSQVDQLRALPVPPGDEAAVKRIIDTAQKDVNAVKTNPDLLVKNQPAFKDANELAKAYGLTVCASG